MTSDPHLRAFASLVKRLRVVQKASGSGYKTTSASAEAKTLECEVDAEVQRLLDWTPKVPTK